MHAVVSLLDKKSSRAVRSLSKELEKTLGVQAPDPHISYQGATDYNFVKLENNLRRFARRSHRFRVHAGGVGLFSGFTPTLYIPVVRTPAPYYKIEFWVPHITLARDIDYRKISKVISLLSRKELDLDIIVDNLAVIFYNGVTHDLRSKIPIGQSSPRLTEHDDLLE